MVVFDQFQSNGNIPIYLQIILFIKKGIIAKSIVNNEELPSRRYLSTLLGINPNTVQKAFRILEEEGLISSSAGAKSVITVDEEKITSLKKELLREDLQNLVQSMKAMGVDKEEVFLLIEEYWREEERRVWNLLSAVWIYRCG